MKASNYEANGNLVRAIIAESGPTADWLNAKLKEKGGEIHFGTPATALLMGKDGSSVVGVVAKRVSGAKLTINAKSVILAMAWTIFDQGTVDRMRSKGTVSIVDLYGTWKDRPQRFMEMGEPNDTDEYIKESAEPFDLDTVLAEGEKVGLVVKAAPLRLWYALSNRKSPE
jgi:hypothetical protein